MQYVVQMQKKNYVGYGKQNGQHERVAYHDIGRVDVVTSFVFLVSGKLAQLSRDMICCTSVRVPISVDPIGGDTCNFVLAISIIISLVLVLVAPSTFTGGVA
jgi:hypothetical protein